MQNKPIKIIGGGIAGLTLAAFLEKENSQPDNEMDT